MPAPSGRVVVASGLARVATAPFWAGLAGAVSVVAIPAAPFLVPVAAARLTRSVLGAGSAWAALAMAALTPFAAFLLALFLTPDRAWIAAVSSCALLSLPALGFAAAARDGRRLDRVYLVGACLTGIGVLSLLLGVEAGANVDAGRFLSARIESLLPDAVAACRAAGWSESMLETLGGLFRFSRIAVEFALPGLGLAFAALFAAVVAYPLGGAAGLRDADVSEPLFSRFSTPVGVTILFVPAGLLAALGGGDERVVAAAILLPLLVLFFLRGLAIIRAFLDRARSGFIARALVYALVMQMPLPLVLALGGLFDEFIDFRARFNRAANDAEDDEI